ncbi:MAG: ABC transporter ATP-binding protein/permease [Bacteroidales bacterium]|nr:ABC transporter ATP-binding protein/permease [Bacteroidales bacterium]
MRKLSRLLSFARPYSKYCPQYVVFTFFGMIFGMVNFALIKPLLDVVFDPNAMSIVKQAPSFTFSIDYIIEIFNYYFTQIVQAYGRMGALIFVAIAVIFASFLSNLLKYGGQCVMASLRTEVIFKIREALMDKITRLDIAYFNKKKKGDIISVMSNDITEVQANVIKSFHVVLREPFLILGYFIALFYMSYQLTIITLVILPLSALLISRVTRKLRAAATKAQAILGQLLAMIEESISGARIIKAFNGQQYVRKKFRIINREQTNLHRNICYKQELASPLSEFLGITIAMVILLFGGWWILNAKSAFTVSSFIVYLVFYYQILVPLKSIATAYTDIKKGMASADRIFEIIDTPIVITKTASPIEISSFKNNIEFKNVCFTYQSSPVLHNINIPFNKGKMYAVVGPSGAGKTTMADLIPRFYDVTSGAILVDGIDIRQYQPKQLMNLIGVVNQEPILFNDTIHNNIAFGMENVSEEAIIEAAKIANAHEFIMELEQGYQSNIGDRGGKLSGGQKQRISIARAVLKNPPILILDEATSSLDTESERLVQDALTNLMKNRTSIVIAHRLSTIQHADQIIVLQKGEIKETGTHSELIALQDGIYHRLCSLQAFE